MIRKKNLIFLGGPGAGKGTFSAMLTAEEPLAHISTGDMLRSEIAKNSEMGRRAAVIMGRGELVPDEIVAEMVKGRISMPDCENGFILDGFPRTIRQAELLDGAMQDIAKTLDAVIYFKADDELLLKRLTARIACKKCGEIYNRLFAPPKRENNCDKCDGELFQRPDDSLETAKERLKVFYEMTQPLIDYYKKKNLLITIVESEKFRAYAILKKEIS